ncbi:MAG TPA: TonB-dependent receptor [Gemmatimonadales bacterium]|nr:TonB-dependent receptor [Gemmatimonadales bacterium]
MLKPIVTLGTLVSLFATSSPKLEAQTRSGIITGRVTDSAAAPVRGATVQVVGTRFAVRARDDGFFRIEGLPAGSYRLNVRLFGYAPADSGVSVEAGRTAEVNVRMRFLAQNLQSVLVEATRSGETQGVALQSQQIADNIVTVLPGDVIRALPNYNAAEAAGRMPGVSLERDEGEGKFVQVRGTEPRLTNVTVDGVHVPGTAGGDRIVKLDDVPSDILGAIEVSKTLTADMDGDAIGGSVNLITKTPEGRPQGYVAAQYGHITLLNHDHGQGSITYGGRFGADSRFGFLIGGSLDRIDRVINDVEPSWTVDGAGRSVPIEWSQRDYTYYRTRDGVGADVDYRISDRSSVYLKGLWSLFKNHGTRYVYDIAGGGDSAGVGTSGYDTSAVLTRQVQVRTPTEQLWGLTAGGNGQRGAWTLTYSANLSGTRQSVNDYRTSDYDYSGSGSTPRLTFKYDAANSEMPLYEYFDAAQATAANDPSNFPLTGYSASNGLTTGRDYGGQVNAQLAYVLGTHPSSLKLGLRLRDEQKQSTQGDVSFADTAAAPFMMNQALSAFSDPSYYSRLSAGFAMGPVPDLNTTQDWENGNSMRFANQTDTVGNLLASFTGSERIYAGYVMNTVALGHLSLNLGLRVEATRSDYTGNAAATDTAGNTTVSPVTGAQNYTDLFPSVQLRYAADQNTNLRIAFTRGIARPNYSDIAPSLQGSLDPIYKFQYDNLSAGNPDLRPEHSWNYDLLLERFLPSLGGVVSAGVFYKALSDVILTRNFIYQGPYAPFLGYYGTQPQNGGSGHVVGFEAQWVQHLTFLPGRFSGLGFDVNWTHADSKVLVDPASGREAPLLRQAPDIANVGLTYNQGPISGRVAWTYNGAYIGGYGDGSATADGDNYFYEHSQIDASVIYNLKSQIQIQVQGLNLNNAQFGFFQGTLDHRYNVQREYYGETLYLGMKFGF